MTTSFHSGFISWLDRISPQTVTEARHGELPLPGHVYVAPADQHLVVRGNHITYSINGHIMTDLVDGSPAALQAGRLALQLHQGFTMDIQFKDVKIKLLAP